MISVEAITAEQWHAWTLAEREEFREYWAQRGIGYYVCLGCGFPVNYGESCRHSACSWGKVDEA